MLGAKVILNVQLRPGLMVKGQLLVTEKGELYPQLLMSKAKSPVLLTVTNCGALVVLTF